MLTIQARLFDLCLTSLPYSTLPSLPSYLRACLIGIDGSKVTSKDSEDTQENLTAA